MNKKLYVLIVFSLFFNVLLFGQNKIILTNGKSFISTSVNNEKESVKLNIDGIIQTVPKDEILCIIPEEGKAYTFHQKRNKKIKINNKDIFYNYEGTDQARIFAYKYFGTSYSAEQLYSLNPNSSMSKGEFEIIYKEQQKSLKTKAIVAGTVSLVLGVAVFLMGLGSLNRSLNDAKTYSNNSININDFKIYNTPQYYLTFENCA